MQKETRKLPKKEQAVEYLDRRGIVGRLKVFLKIPLKNIKLGLDEIEQKSIANLSKDRAEIARQKRKPFIELGLDLLRRWKGRKEIDPRFFHDAAEESELVATALKEAAEDAIRDQKEEQEKKERSKRF